MRDVLQDELATAREELEQSQQASLAAREESDGLKARLQSDADAAQQAQTELQQQNSSLEVRDGQSCGQISRPFNACVDHPRLLICSWRYRLAQHSATRLDLQSPSRALCKWPAGMGVWHTRYTLHG